MGPCRRVQGRTGAYRGPESTPAATKAVDLMRARDTSPMDADRQRPDLAIYVGVSQHPAGDGRASRRLNGPWAVTWDGPVTRTSSSLQPPRAGPVPDRPPV